MGPRKPSKTENGEHQSPIYLKHVSNFKASLRRRDSARFLRTKVNIKRFSFTALLYICTYTITSLFRYANVSICTSTTQENDKAFVVFVFFFVILKEA